MARSRWREGLRQLVVWLDGLMPYAQTEQVLAQVGQVSVSTTTAWRQLQIYGAQAQAVEAQQRAQAGALPARQDIVPGEVRSTARLAAVVDGAMLHIRQEGWKELKVGGVGQIALRPRADPQTGEMVDLAHVTATTYVAHLGGPEPFGQQLWAEAQAHGWGRAAETVVLGDGAQWIWNLAGEHFHDSVQIVDWYHAKQHLCQAAHLLHGEGTPAAQRWLQQHETWLFEGHTDRLAQVLLDLVPRYRKVATELKAQAHYFRENYRRMQYLEQRENDYPIGSGTVESGCKQFRARLAGPGMRWSRTGAERLLPIRAAILSQRFEGLWKTLQALPQN